MKKTTKKLGELLIEAGLIDELQLNSALAYQDQWGGRIGSVLMKKGFVSEEEITSVIGKQFGISCVSLDKVERPSKEVLNMVKVDIAKKFGIFPIGLEGKTILIATADPTDLKTLDDISFTLGARIKPLLALESDITRHIRICYEGDPDSDTEKIAMRARGTIDPTAEKLYGDILERPLEVDGSKPRSEVSQKIVIESIVDLLVSKGIFTKDELLRRINSKRQ